MGFTPQQVGAMSWWQFLACADGYALKNGGKPKLEPPSDEKFLAWADMVRKLKPSGKGSERKPPLSKTDAFNR